MNFVKMHGTGNDFIMIDNTKDEFNLSTDQIKNMCDRHFGVGADGLILVEKGTQGGDVFMNYFNADGSTAEMCGNGSRCTAFFANQFLGFNEPRLNLETRAGIKIIDLMEDNFLRVNMGAPKFTHQDFPKEPQSFDQQKFYFASMGNPHAVGFFDSEKEIDHVFLSLGSKIESNIDYFPSKINVNFVTLKGDNHLFVRTFERDCGPTLACGTGASASFAIATKSNQVSDKTIIDVPGGRLIFQWNDYDEILMSGPAKIVFEGSIDLQNY